MENSTNASNAEQEFWEAVFSNVHYKISENIGKYVLFIIFLLGTMGNLLSFAVMTRRTMRSSSTAFYMASLALADTMVLIVGCLRRWVYEVFEVDLLNAGPVACSTVNFLQYWSFDVAVWILVVMTIDRAIVVISPLKAYKYATKRRAIVALLVLMVTCAGINAHYFFTTIFIKNICSGDGPYLAFHQDIWPWIDATVYSFVPFAILLVMNIIIITCLSKANAKKRRMTNNGQMRRKSDQHGAVNSRKLSIMLLSITTAFLLLTAPASVLQIYRDPFFDQTNIERVAKYIMTRQLIRVLLYMNHSINFFLYCITGSKFRRELVAMVRCQNSREVRRRSTAVSIPNGSVSNVGYLPSPDRETAM